jgi:predicted acylesterase/phospholipase RssA
MVFVGALKVFEAQGHSYERLLGTSAGAITAALLAAGYGSGEMMDALQEKRDGRPVFAEFMGVPAAFDEKAVRDSATRAFLRDLDLPLIPDFAEAKLDDQIVKVLAGQPRFRHFFSFVERGGWYSADSFVEWMENKLNTGTYEAAPRRFGSMTLGQFYEATQSDLSVVASDTSGGRMLVLNHRTAPDCPLVWAVRMSMNIPLLWQEVIWQAEWGTYRGMDLAGHVIVDGGMLSNFPIELFVSSQPTVTAVMGPKTSQNVMGLLIDDTLPVAGVSIEVKEEKQLDLGSLRTVQRVMHLINTMMQAHDKMVIEAFERLVVRLPAQGYGTTEFDMSDEKRTLLVSAGEQAMQEYLAQQPTPKGAQEGAVPKGITYGVPRPDAAARIADRIASRILG